MEQRKQQFGKYISSFILTQSLLSEHLEQRSENGKRLYYKSKKGRALVNKKLKIVTAFYSRNPLISLMRDKIVLQLQLIMPGSVSMTLCRKCSISSLDEATACTCSLSLPVTR